MPPVLKSYIRKARHVLNANWTGSYTVPAQGLYPHQWNWDSGFIAIGYSHYDTGRAVRELTHLFRGQWKNGMLPQIVFNERRLGEYFPEPDFWQTERSPHAPRDVLTSGITMPPVHALAALNIYENASRPDRTIDFLRWIYPRLLDLHRYLYRERDPDGTGLVYIRHPWESGMDNSPMWDTVFESIDMSGMSIPPYTRKDLSHGVAAEMRPRDRDYDRFVLLVDIARRNAYDEAAIRRDCPFLIQEPLFNAILCASNEALEKISDIIGESPGEAAAWADLTRKAISERLFHAGHGMFDYYDLNRKMLYDIDTAAGFLPLLCGAATPEQASALYDRLNSQSFCALRQGNCYTIPNYDTRRKDFDRGNYWRGPVWININWMLMKGLRRYGYYQKADAVAKDILQLAMRFGFREYYDSFDGRGLGSGNFSWTAALFIDTAREVYERTGERPLLQRFRSRVRKERVLNEGGAAADVASEDLSQKMLDSIRAIRRRHYTKRGTVDYGAIRKAPEYEQYRRLTARLREYDLSRFKDEDEALAFWINLYNTIVVDGIIALGIRHSVRERLGFFSRIQYRIDGNAFSPDDMEHGILRANARPPHRPCRQFAPFDPRRRFSFDAVDPRIHFALVCGSRSCAPIRYYTAERIRDELEQAARAFVNSSEVIVIPEERTLFLSSIFLWYGREFGGTKGVLDFIAQRLVDDDKREFLKANRKSLSLHYLYYDWNLNIVA